MLGEAAREGHGAIRPDHHHLFVQYFTERCRQGPLYLCRPCGVGVVASDFWPWVHGLGGVLLSRPCTCDPPNCTCHIYTDGCAQGRRGGEVLETEIPLRAARDLQRDNSEADYSSWANRDSPQYELIRRFSVPDCSDGQCDMHQILSSEDDFIGESRVREEGVHFAGGVDENISVTLRPDIVVLAVTSAQHREVLVRREEESGRPRGFVGCTKLCRGGLCEHDVTMRGCGESVVDCDRCDMFGRREVCVAAVVAIAGSGKYHGWGVGERRGGLG
ncbi:hypothetical protein Tco_0128683 [Tanacetum coccineum]